MIGVTPRLASLTFNTTLSADFTQPRLTSNFLASGLPQIYRSFPDSNVNARANHMLASSA
jgi:hypothetical protein